VTAVNSPLADALRERYVLERELGRGGMATVYLAHDLRHDRSVALKVLRPELAATLGPERFLHEIRIAAGLQHPHILPVFDSGDAAGQLWYTMPYVEGETLRQRLVREKQLPLDDARRISLQVLSALEYAHGHGVIHRDIKPENILLEDDQAVVADLGIARAMSAVGEDRLTETGLSLGTPAYMSPEQACAEPNLDRRTDLYSLGCVLYEMLVGEPPYTGPTPQAIVARRLTEPPPRLRTTRDVPESLEQAIHRALARNAADRFATARDFARAITQDETTAPGRAASHLPAPTPWRRAPRALVGALLLALALGLAWFAYRRATPAVPPGSASRIAVLPFAVRGSGSFSYLAEGMVDLLSRDLDGAGDLRTVDAGTILTAAAQNDRDGVLDVERGRTVARRVSAGLYVIGSVHAVGGRVRIQATLYDGADESSGVKTQATVEGDSTRLFELVDRLSAQLIVKRGRGPVTRLAETAAITTRSLVALKAYLDGERRLRAASLQPARIDSAITMFQQAITEDSTFALAQYRMAVAAGWANRPALATVAAGRALTLSDRLTERDRRLLTAYVDFRRGAANSAERQYRAILQDYPDDLEALFQLADVLYNYNPLRGRPRGEARELFTQVLDLDPGFL
jgi:eukaryotic-like serine/threonine-protein kinase